MLSEDFVQELQQTITLDLITHYDMIKNSIDIYSQMSLMLLEGAEQSEKEINQENLKRKNVQLITAVEEISRINMKEIAEFFISKSKKLQQIDFYTDCNYSEEDMKRLIITKYCFYISPEALRPCRRETNDLGVLITSDWYLNSDEISFIRKDLEEYMQASVGLNKNNLTLQFDHTTYSLSSDIIDLHQDTIKSESAILQSLKLESYAINLFSPGSLSHFVNLKKLNLSNNPIKKLSRNSFDKLLNLQVLLLNDCEIKTIEIDCFRALTNLRSLNLARNFLKTIDKDLLKGLVSLETLTLKSCRIFIIKDGTYLSVPRLKELDLSNNPIETITKSVFSGLINLEKLDLSRCQSIKKIEPRALGTLVSLRELDLPNLEDSVCNNISSIFPNMEMASLEAC